MFRNLLINTGLLATLLLSPSSVPAQIDSQPISPKIACKQPVYEFGAVDNSQSVEHTFVIWNDGNAPLQIERIHGCCGASTKIADKTIAPGTNTTLDIKLSLRGRKGKQRKSFYIAANDPKQPYYQLRFIGTAIAGVDIQPRSVNFGNILSDAVVERDVSIVCQTNFAFNITNLVSTVPRFAVSCERSDGTAHRLKVRTVPPMPPGVTRGNVQIFTDNPKYRKIELLALATVSSDIVVVPKEILLVESAGKPRAITRHIAIRSRSKKAFKILKVEAPEPDIEVKTDPLGPGGYRCDLRNIMPFPDLDGRHIVITTDHEDARGIAIPIRVVPKESVKK